MAQLENEEIEEIVRVCEVAVHGEGFKRAPMGVPLCEPAAWAAVKAVAEAAWVRGVEDGLKEAAETGEGENGDEDKEIGKVGDEHDADNGA